MKFYFRRIFQGDLVIWIVFFLLCMISLVEVFSAASSLSYKTGDFLAPLFKQAAFLAAGTAVVWFFHALPCRYFKIIPVFFLPICVILLILTLFFGVRTNEGARWLYILGIRFQPAELAKGVVIITTALILACWQREEGADRRAMKWILVSSGVVCLLIFSENLSTAVILFGTVFLMMFLGRVPLIQLGKIVAFFVALILGAVLLVETLPKETLNDVPGLHRIDTWVARLTDHTSDVENDTVFLAEHPQEAHANIAIASSNFIGKGPATRSSATTWPRPIPTSSTPSLPRNSASGAPFSWSSCTWCCSSVRGASPAAASATSPPSSSWASPCCWSIRPSSTCSWP